jgi:transposase
MGYRRSCRRSSGPIRSRASSTCSVPKEPTVKLLFWDQTGLCLLTKRLEGAKFRWPAIADGVMRLSPAQLSALLEGLDWSRVHARRVVRPTATQ